MKKIFTILLTAAMVLAASCTQMDKTIVNSGDSIAPVILASSTSKGLSATYVPGEIVINGEKVDSSLVHHFFAAVMIDSTKVNLAISSKDIDSTNTVTASSATLSALLLSRGYEYGTSAKITFVLRAGLSSVANSGCVDSEETLEVNLKLKKPSGGAYATFTETSTWSVIGAIASTGNNWNADEEMATDGEWHVCENITLTTEDKFKFRNNASWTENFGGVFSALDEEFDVTQDGPDIKIDADGVYDLLLNPATGKAKVVVHKEDPFAAFTEDSPWSVIGAIASTGNNWNADEEMVSDGTWHVCQSVELTTEDKFKFRKDAAWGTNFGGVFSALDEEFDVTQDGPDIKVDADGTYHLYLNPETAKAKVVKAN